MNSHISDELPRLLSGEATRQVVLDAAAHLRTCPDCQQELVSAVVAHASLTSAQRFAPEVVGRPAPVADSPGEPRALPDLAVVFAQVRDEVGRVEPRARSKWPVYLAAAAAAGVVIGGGGVALVHDVGSSSPSARTVALAAYDVGTQPARAKITSAGQMSLDATALPHLSGAKRYEVWLTNDARTKMQPIGWIGGDGRATLTVPSSLMSSYSDIEVSVQSVDAASYDYSNVSVLRGAYA